MTGTIYVYHVIIKTIFKKRYRNRYKSHDTINDFKRIRNTFIYKTSSCILYIFQRDLTQSSVIAKYTSTRSPFYNTLHILFLISAFLLDKPYTRSKNFYQTGITTKHCVSFRQNITKLFSIWIIQKTCVFWRVLVGKWRKILCYYFPEQRIPNYEDLLLGHSHVRRFERYLLQAIHQLNVPLVWISHILWLWRGWVVQIC